ncbi:hypothetical protein NDU88_008236 [Pleurodeles waltl]|uniref:Uncharacterized protein n=1 Tax=Pleurodeles waltl TaxID=8319 RepID=A0AAV7QP46_PLEWA|nr:hypothetical protein NDU88_008236 [Pleurodeles waltl]
MAPGLNQPAKGPLSGHSRKAPPSCNVHSRPPTRGENPHRRLLTSSHILPAIPRRTSEPESQPGVPVTARVPSKHEGHSEGPARAPLLRLSWHCEASRPPSGGAERPRSDPTTEQAFREGAHRSPLSRRAERNTAASAAHPRGKEAAQGGTLPNAAGRSRGCQARPRWVENPAAIRSLDRLRGPAAAHQARGGHPKKKTLKWPLRQEKCSN